MYFYRLAVNKSCSM